MTHGRDKVKRGRRRVFANEISPSLRHAVTTSAFCQKSSSVGAAWITTSDELSTSKGSPLILYGGCEGKVFSLSAFFSSATGEKREGTLILRKKNPSDMLVKRRCPRSCLEVCREGKISPTTRRSATKVSKTYHAYISLFLKHVSKINNKIRMVSYKEMPRRLSFMEIFTRSMSRGSFSIDGPCPWSNVS